MNLASCILHFEPQKKDWYTQELLGLRINSLCSAGEPINDHDFLLIILACHPSACIVRVLNLWGWGLIFIGKKFFHVIAHFFFLIGYVSTLAF